jgi:hypothetical protein
LEAGELRDAAAAVEHAFRAEKKEEMTALLDALEKVLIPAMAATATLAGSKVAIPPSPLSSPASFDHVEAMSMLTELRQHIATNSLKARKLFAPLSGMLAGCGADEEVGELGSRMERLDFTGALVALDRLVVKLDLPEGKSS